MKKLFKKLMISLFAVIMLLGFSNAALAGYDHYVINIYEDTGYRSTAGGYPTVTDTVRYVVFNGGTFTLATIYSDSGTNARSNPVEATTYATQDKIDFYIDDSVTTVDIQVMDLDGYAVFLRNATTSTRTCIIDKKPGLHVGVADWYVTLASQSALTGAATDFWTFESDIMLIPRYATEVITASSVSGIQLQGNLNGTAGGLFVYHPVDGAKVLSWVSTLYTTTDSPTLGSLFLGQACTADMHSYDSPGTAFWPATGSTMTFSAASCPEEGDEGSTVTEDLAHGWGFYHFWFYKMR